MILVVATIFGIIIGPVGLNLIELPSFNDSQHFILQFARITIAITVSIFLSGRNTIIIDRLNIEFIAL
jgi:NhaP-type Na+/H+ or K+/H+ antiporter